MGSSLLLRYKKTRLLSWRNHPQGRKIKKDINLWESLIEHHMILSCFRLKGRAQPKTRSSRTSTSSIQRTYNRLLRSLAMKERKEKPPEGIKRLKKFWNSLITSLKEVHKFIEVGIKDTLEIFRQIKRQCLSLRAQSKSALSKWVYLSIRTCVELKRKLGQGL